MADIYSEIDETLDDSPRQVMSEDLAKKDFPPIKWAVPGLIPEGCTFLAGKPKMGKSWMALNIACAIAEGGMALSKIAVPKGEVLYLAMEDNQRRLKTRMEKVTGGNAPAGIHFFTNWRRMDDLGSELLYKYLEDHPAIKFVVVDTLQKVKGRGRGGSQYEDDYDAVGDLHRIAHQYGVAILVVHHLKKQSTDDPMDQISGTLGLTGAADGMLVLARERGAADAVLHVTGRDIEEDGAYALEWDQKSAIWVLLGDAKALQPNNERQAIVDVMTDAEPMTVREIANKTGMDYDNLRQIVYKMEKDGPIKRVGGSKNSGYTFQLDPYYNNNNYYNRNNQDNITGSCNSSNSCNGGYIEEIKTPWEYRLLSKPTFSTAFLPTDDRSQAFELLQSRFGKDQVITVRVLQVGTDLSRP